MNSPSNSEPSRIGNPKNEKFRGLDDLDQDVFFDIGQRIIDWIQATTGGENSHHFGIREPQHDKDGIKTGKATLRSLLLVSRKFNSIWTPIAIRNVNLWTYQLPSFLRFLLNHPELGSKIRSLNFIIRGEGELLDAEDLVEELKSIEHSRSVMTGKTKAHPLINALGDARSLIIEQCSNLKELTFNAGIYFSFKLQDSLRPIFSETLISIKTVRYGLGGKDEDFFTEFRTGRQALALMIFLPSLQSISMDIELTHEDAKVINTHLAPLIKSRKAVSNVKNLSLKVHQILREGTSLPFNFDLTFKTFLSIFNALENLSLIFYEDPILLDQAPSAPARRASIEQLPTLDCLQGLNNCSSTLKSLSVEGQDYENLDSRERDIEADRFYSIVERMRNLNHLRLDGPGLLSLASGYFEADQASATPPKGAGIQSLEIAANYSSGGTYWEEAITKAVGSGLLEESLKSIRSPAHPTSINEGDPEKNGLDRSRFHSERQELLAMAKSEGIEVEFV